jgi:hypothetical protein
MKRIKDVDDFNARLSAAVADDSDTDNAVLAAQVADDIAPAARRAILIHLIEPEIDLFRRLQAHRIETEARDGEHLAAPDVFTLLYDDPTLWRPGEGGIWFGSAARAKFRTWCKNRGGKHNRSGFDDWLTRAMATDPDEEFKLDWLPGYYAERRSDAVAKMLLEYADTIRFNVTAELLGSTFATGDGTRVSWRDATVAQHEERVGLLTKTIAGTSETAAMHITAVQMIKDAGVETLGQLPGGDSDAT